MASPRDLTGMLRWWSADAPADTDSGRVTASADLIAGSVATRFGQGRVGPELVLVDGKPVWRFGGSASPASLLTPDVPSIPGAGYTWFFVLTPTAGYAGQAIAPGPNTAVTSSSAQLLAEASGSFRWTAFAGASTSLPMPSGEQLIVLDHDGGTGATRLYVTGQGSARATLQRRSLAGQQHIGRHGSNDRPLAADVKAIGLVDHSLSDSEVALLEQWRAEGASSATIIVRTALARATTRTRTAARPAKQRPAPARTVTRSTSAARDAAVRRATARAVERTTASAGSRPARAALAPTRTVERPAARASGVRTAPAPAVTETSARARSAARKAVEASATTVAAGEALSVALRAAAARVRTFARTAGAAAASRGTLARAVTRTLGTALHRRPRPATDRDVEVFVGEPAAGMSVGTATTAWTVGEPAAAWTVGPPTLDAR